MAIVGNEEHLEKFVPMPLPVRSVQFVSGKCLR
jgi:hypothetical protein